MAGLFALVMMTGLAYGQTPPATGGQVAPSARPHWDSPEARTIRPPGKGIVVPAARPELQGHANWSYSGCLRANQDKKNPREWCDEGERRVRMGIPF